MRTGDVVFGIFFLGLGATIAALGDGWAYLAAAALVVLVVEAIISGARGMRSWLSRIGPLP
jgi:hypothetical protein